MLLVYQLKMFYYFIAVVIYVLLVRQKQYRQLFNILLNESILDNHDKVASKFMTIVILMIKYQQLYLYLLFSRRRFYMFSDRQPKLSIDWRVLASIYYECSKGIYRRIFIFVLLLLKRFFYIYSHFLSVVSVFHDIDVYPHNFTYVLLFSPLFYLGSMLLYNVCTSPRCTRENLQPPFSI